jgi:hypothetical protein
MSKNWAEFWTVIPSPQAFQLFCSGTKGAANSGVEITVSKINEWMQVERLRKIRADRYNQFFGRVRKTFIYLFIATILVFVLNHYTEIQGATYAKLGHVVNNAPGSEKLRQSAFNYQKQVDDITQ